MNENTQQNQSSTLSHLKSLFYSGDFTNFLLQLLGTSDNYLIDSVHIAIILNSLGLLKTRFNLSKFLYCSDTKNLIKGNIADLTLEYSSKCIDLQALYTFYLAQMRVHEEAIPYSTSASRLNTLTDASCLMMVMEDQEVSIAALANYLIHNLNKQRSALLETDAKDMLEFKAGAKYTLRQFIGS